MHQYSPFFKTLHNEVTPAGYIGRGTHYTILRCVIWHDHMLIPLKKGKYLAIPSPKVRPPWREFCRFLRPRKFGCRLKTLRHLCQVS